jgi:hypothetical protein
LERNVDSERRPSKSRDVFGDYLQSISSVKTGAPQPEAESSEAPAEAPAAVESLPQEGSLGLIPVLTYLREHDDQSLPELAAGLGSPILQTAEVINKLAASGVLELHGDPGSERVKLTEAGVNLSSVG